MIAVLCTGCSSYAVPRYGVSVTNVAALRQTGAQKVSVGAFTASGGSKTEIGCRAVGPVKTPDERPFEEYIRKALIDELQVAEIYSESGPITLTGNLDQIDFSSTAGKWSLGVTVKSSNGRPGVTSAGNTRPRRRTAIAGSSEPRPSALEFVGGRNRVRRCDLSLASYSEPGAEERANRTRQSS